MNRYIIVVIFCSLFFIFPQNNSDNYLEEANKKYINGDYEGAFTLINHYIFINEDTGLSNKAVDLGEKIYFFFIRSQFYSDEFIGLTFIDKSLKENAALKSERVEEALDYLRNKDDQPPIDLEPEFSDTEELLENDSDIISDLSQDELTNMLRQSLLDGQATKNQMSRITFLLIFFITSTLVVVIGIWLYLVFSSKNKKNRANISSPVLMGINNNIPVDLSRLIELCRHNGEKINIATGRKNNSINIAELVYKVSVELKDENALINYAVALVYDIGLLDIDSGLLNKKSLTDSEFKIIQQHVLYNGSFLSEVPKKYISYFTETISKHHENVDGTGYPLGIKDDEISFLPKLIRVVESYISIVSARGYKIISDKETAIEQLRSRPGVYDVSIVDVLNRVI